MRNTGDRTIKLSREQKYQNDIKEQWYKEAYLAEPNVIHYSEDLKATKRLTAMEKELYANLLKNYLQGNWKQLSLSVLADRLQTTSPTIYRLILSLFRKDILYIKYTRWYGIDSIQILKFL